MAKTMQTFKFQDDLISDLKKESHAIHGGNFNGYVEHLLLTHPTRGVNRSIAKSKRKPHP